MTINGKKSMIDVKKLGDGIRGGDRRSLAKAITLVESTVPGDRLIALQLLEQLPAGANSRRIGISGPPGAGKSTLIDHFGDYLCKMGHRVAVLAIDPSSQVSGGAILGDKTRMERLSKCNSAFIRPSPSKRGTLGGTTPSAMEVIQILEAAQFETIFIETIGVGQNEIDAAALTDLMILVLAPALGDELQGVKRGITEVSDIILVNKDDGELGQAVDLAVQEYVGALRGTQKDVLRCSALQGTGFDDLNACIDRRMKVLEGELISRRLAQSRQQFWRRLEQEWLPFVQGIPLLNDMAQDLLSQMEGQGGLSVRRASEKYYNQLKNLLTATEK